MTETFKRSTSTKKLIPFTNPGSTQYISNDPLVHHIVKMKSQINNDS